MTWVERRHETEDTLSKGLKAEWGELLKHLDESVAAHRRLFEYSPLKPDSSISGGVFSVAKNAPVKSGSRVVTMSVSLHGTMIHFATTQTEGVTDIKGYLVFKAIGGKVEITKGPKDGSVLSMDDACEIILGKFLFD
jgi:hypothetical protein